MSAKSLGDMYFISFSKSNNSYKMFLLYRTCTSTNTIHTIKVDSSSKKKKKSPLKICQQLLPPSQLPPVKRKVKRERKKRFLITLMTVH